MIGGGSYEELARWRDILLAKIEESNPGLTDIDWDYKETNRSAAADGPAPKRPRMPAIRAMGRRNREVMMYLQVAASVVCAMRDALLTRVDWVNLAVSGRSIGRPGRSPWWPDSNNAACVNRVAVQSAA